MGVEMSACTKKHILVITYDNDIWTRLRDLVHSKQESFSYSGVRNQAAALTFAQIDKPDLIIIASKGLDTAPTIIREVRKKVGFVPVLYLVNKNDTHRYNLFTEWISRDFTESLICYVKENVSDDFILLRGNELMRGV